MADDAVPLLVGARQEAGHVLEDDQRDPERVAEAHEPRALDGGVDVEHARQHGRLVRHDPDALAAEAGEADHDVGGEVRVDLEERAPVHHAPDDLVDVVRLVRVGRHERVQLRVGAVGGVTRRDRRWGVLAVGGQVGHQLADAHQEGALVGERAVADA